MGDKGVGAAHQSVGGGQQPRHRRQRRQDNRPKPQFGPDGHLGNEFRRVANQCHEDRADAPNDKTRANFCDYFTLNTQAYVGKTKDSGAALTAAEALFGNAPAQEEDKLKGDHTVSEHEAKSAAAREELKKLFGDE